MPKLTIDGQEIEVEAGTSIIQAAEQLGIEIPRFCYHDRLSVPANCRMCLVEVSPGPPKPQASCALACQDGMEVKTDSEMVQKARKGVMEFLLINHPLDCPICDQGGECDLQDQAMAYGFDRSRYHENKRAVKNKELGPLIKTIMTRCIHCTRCVRFGQDIAGVTELGLLNRGENVEIGTFIESAVSTELSGNMIDVCPVGALTSKPYAFTARPWELRKTDTIDCMDAVGSNIRADAKGNEVMRVLPRLHEGINEEWISDKTRFSYDGLMKRRLDVPYVRLNGKLHPVSWNDALDIVAEKLNTAAPERIAALVGDQVDVESAFALKGIMDSLGVKSMDCRTDGARFDVTDPVGYSFNSGIEGIEEADAILLVGTNPRYEASMVNARIRKSWLHNKTPIAMIGQAEDLTYPYDHIGEAAQDIEKLLAARSGFAKVLKDAKRPMIIAGQGAFRREDGMAIHGLLHKLAEKVGCVSKDWNGFNMLHMAAGRVGALNIGFVPQADGFNIYDMVQAGQNNALDVMFLHGVDELDVRAAFGKETFVVYQGHHGDNGAKDADVIFPGAAFTEKNALYVNTEGRVQIARQTAFPPGEAKEDWKILRALSEKMGKTLPYDTLQELRAKLFESHPSFSNIDTLPQHKWGEFGSKGKLVKQPFQSIITNFYQTCPISRASEIMSECVAEFVAPKVQQEAAE